MHKKNSSCSSLRERKWIIYSENINIMKVMAEETKLVYKF